MNIFQKSKSEHMQKETLHLHSANVFVTFLFSITKEGVGISSDP